MTITQAELDKRFDYHAPNATTVKIHESIRASIKDMAANIVAEFGESREVSLALTKIEELEMWLHAHVARNMTHS